MTFREMANESGRPGCWYVLAVISLTVLCITLVLALA